MKCPVCNLTMKQLEPLKHQCYVCNTIHFERGYNYRRAVKIENTLASMVTVNQLDDISLTLI